MRQVAGAQHSERRFVCLPDALAQCLQNSQPSRGDTTEDLTAVCEAALATDQSLRLQAIHQTCDPRRLLDHAVGDLERRESGLARASENAQDVVLLDGDAEGLDDGREVPAQKIRRAQESDDGLFRFPREGLVLLDLLLDATAVSGHGADTLHGNS